MHFLQKAKSECTSKARHVTPMGEHTHFKYADPNSCEGQRSLAPFISATYDMQLDEG